VWNLVFRNGFSVIALSKTEEDAKELVRRIRFILDHLPHWIIKKKEWEYTALSVTLKNNKDDSTFKAFPASPEAGRSFTANIVILDEWAKQQWAREIWQAAFPTINRPTGGQVIGLSTIERGTLFEDLWLGDNGFKKIYLPWDSDPRRSEKWYNNTRKAMGDGTLSEYPKTVEEAFSIPGGAFFTEFRSSIHLKPSIGLIPSWYTRYRTLDYGLDCLACYWIYIDTQGFARIYKEVHKEGLIISRSAYEILKMSGAKVPDTPEEWDSMSREEKKAIANTQTDKCSATFAPPDLFSRAKDTGRSNAEIWVENGIDMIKTKNSHQMSLSNLCQWLHPIIRKDEQTGESYTTAKLTIDDSSAPNLVHSLLNIQKDKYNPNVYSEHPHSLTHSIAAVKGWAIEYVVDSTEPEKPKPQWIKELSESKSVKGSFMTV
jgi:hypothetical protein